MNRIFSNYLKKNLKMFSGPLLLSFLFLKNKNFKFSKTLKSESSKNLENSETNLNGKKVYLPQLKEIKENELKQLKFGEGKYDSILLVNYNNKLHALSNYCPHFGAPMHSGYLINNLVKCPWHGASFNIENGKTEISPSVNDLIKYEIFEDKELNKDYIIIKENYNNLPLEIPLMAKRDLKNETRFLIAGGGPAALSCAETLRQNNFTGEIIIVSKDKYYPYDRTLISKYVPKTVENVSLRKKEFYDEYNIEFKLNQEITEIDYKNKKIKLKNEENLKFDKLLLATGGDPLVPKIKGKDLKHVFTLRNFEDLEQIAEYSKNSKNLVIVGSSFIGLEAASMLKKTYKNLNITIVDPNDKPLARTLGPEIGSAVQD